MHWGYHLILDAGRCASSRIRCAKNIDGFARALVQRIDMVPFGHPQVHHFGSGAKAGYTLVQLIETSNITAHFVEETDDMYLDVFSCKPFEASVVSDTVREFFKYTEANVQFLTRQAPRLS